MNNIKKIRLQKGLTQKELADLTKLSVWYISDIERGKRKPSLKALARIAKALDVPMNIFLN